AAAGPRRRESHARHGPMLCPPRRTGLGPRLCPPVSHGWFSGVSDGVADALWRLGAAPTTPRQRPPAQATLDAAASAALCAGDQDRAPTASGPGQSSRGGWHAGGRQCRAGATWLADQYRVRGAHQPQHPAACRRGRAPGQHAVQGQRRIAAAAHALPDVLQFLFAPYQLTPAVATAPADQRERLSHAVAAVYARDGGWTDGSGVDPP